MKFTLAREKLIKPLQMVAGVVEKRQTMPVLANILVVVDQQQLLMTGTDMEVEISARIDLEQGAAESGETTIPARKLMDICRALPDSAEITISQEDERVVVSSGKSRFTLSCLAADDFPAVEPEQGAMELQVGQGDLRYVLDRTAFAMAQQDVRYYLNGMLLEISANQIRTVSTDGHRLAMCTLQTAHGVETARQVIFPRKGVLEFIRLLQDSDEVVSLRIGNNHLQAATAGFTFSSKLVDGRFPDYQRVLPRGGERIMTADVESLRHALQRASILSNEKYRGIRLMLEKDTLCIQANNPEQEEALDEMEVSYDGEAMEICFNVSYLLDALNTIKTGTARFTMIDPNSSTLVEEVGETQSCYVVMPMRI
ncbi:DNA polymerase III subunit beta [Pelagibaculum spongiae]|uniref:Beta sliding clamp n=1 Tax=Pelagibaculum spongiae TaxID=2080658 RepID=A0A2V1GU96_9GAMM|nr:DNA polymerase III subunit beta [Pelagibaculum spongiae]PVZ68227.1 DNA polymerase III subunit beta [Pelagibaculum spongiae]